MTEEEFWARVKKCSHGDTCKRCCWPWGTGKKSPASIDGGMIEVVYRIAYRLYYGHFLPRLYYTSRTTSLSQHPVFVVCHQCDNSICCNPLHLKLGTQSDNVRDRLYRRPKPRKNGKAHHVSRNRTK